MSAEAKAARARLAERYQPGGGLDAATALMVVAHRTERPDSGGPPTGADCLDALAQVDDAQAAIELQELAVIQRARALDVPWWQIGRALGYQESSAAQGAVGRYRALAKRHPTAFADGLTRAAIQAVADVRKGQEP